MDPRSHVIQHAFGGSFCVVGVRFTLTPATKARFLRDASEMNPGATSRVDDVIVRDTQGTYVGIGLRVQQGKGSISNLTCASREPSGLEEALPLTL